MPSRDSTFGSTNSRSSFQEARVNAIHPDWGHVHNQCASSTAPAPTKHHNVRDCQIRRPIRLANGSLAKAVSGTSFSTISRGFVAASFFTAVITNSEANPVHPGDLRVSLS